ncbi:hypothetical protein [Phormidium sp. CCY1219]|uniref:hypothetical protein n=1 Tax=Phormidium sp. CCY1219 TaxID=2886104 RepID=UPI002D1F5D02|nr:hypothetical protein [Phormidium sp. CCY1219]MEB3829150.1 hypothetical protein [Phormidium sp. CCY1219]
MPERAFDELALTLDFPDLKTRGIGCLSPSQVALNSEVRGDRLRLSNLITQ